MMMQDTWYKIVFLFLLLFYEKDGNGPILVIQALMD